MKVRIKHDPTYYVIVKDIQIMEKDGNPSIGSGPIEVLTDQPTALEHLVKLIEMKDKLAEIVKESDEKIESCNVEFRLETLDEASNKTASELIKAYGESKKEEENEKIEGTKTDNN